MAFRNGKCEQLRRSRGTAEVEALGAAFVLVWIILFGLWAAKIAKARLDAGTQAQYQAWKDAYGTANPQYAPNATRFAITEVDAGSSLGTSDLANRLHVVQGSQSVSYNPDTSNVAATATATEYAAVPGPTWTFASYPDVNDQAQTGTWFNGVKDQAPSFGVLTDTLKLEDPWTP